MLLSYFFRLRRVFQIAYLRHCMAWKEDGKYLRLRVKSARMAILKNFVPLNIGFGCLSRECEVDHHTTDIAKQLFTDPISDNAILVVASTYIYIQKVHRTRLNARTSPHLFNTQKSSLSKTVHYGYCRCTGAFPCQRLHAQ
jgi:hypothetical protein